jgi:hypothetical protein
MIRKKNLEVEVEKENIAGVFQNIGKEVTVNKKIKKRNRKRVSIYFTLR